MIFSMFLSLVNNSEKWPLLNELLGQKINFKVILPFKNYNHNYFYKTVTFFPGKAFLYIFPFNCTEFTLNADGKSIIYIYIYVYQLKENICN